MERFSTKIHQRLATPDALFTAIVLSLVGVGVGAIAFGASEAKAQLTLAIILGLGTALSLYISMQARLEHLEGQRHQAELDARTVPLQESVNILATDVRALREQEFEALVSELKAMNGHLSAMTTTTASD